MELHLCFAEMALAKQGEFSACTALLGVLGLYSDNGFINALEIGYSIDSSSLRLEL
jgi:hypothetical protein